MKTITAILTISTLFALNGTLLAGESLPTDEGKIIVPPPTNTDHDTWKFKITPYVMIPTLSGNISTKGGDIDLPTAGADSDWQLSLPIVLDIGKGRWGAGLEFFYLGYSGEAKLGRNLITRQNLDFDATFTYTKAFAYYRAIDNEKHLLDLYTGANIIYLKFETELAGIFNGSSDSSDSWADPMIGARYHYNINDTWVLFARGELGAGESTVTWDATLGVDYVLNDHWSFGVGYRSIGLDYSGKDADYEVQLNGPTLSASYTF